MYVDWPSCSDESVDKNGLSELILNEIDLTIAKERLKLTSVCQTASKHIKVVKEVNS